MNRGHKSPSQLWARSDPHAKFLRAHRWSLQGREAGRVQDCGSLRSPEAASQDLGGDGGTTGGLFDATCILYPLACLVSRMCKRVGSAKVGAIYVHFPPPNPSLYSHSLFRPHLCPKLPHARFDSQSFHG